MRKLFFYLSVIILPQINLQGQDLYKYHISVGTTLGFTYLQWESNNFAQWRYLIRPTLGTSALFHRKLDKSWEANSGIGVTYYSIFFKSDTDVYNASFLEPYFIAGIANFNLIPLETLSTMAKLSFGLQPAYSKNFTEEFKNFTAIVEGENAVQVFIVPEIGIRKKSKIGRLYQLSLFYQLGLNNLGQLSLIENNDVTVFKSKGDYVGFTARGIIPVFKKKTINRNRNRKFNDKKAICPSFYKS